jgi:hypothetical protein
MASYDPNSQQYAGQPMAGQQYPQQGGYDPNMAQTQPTYDPNQGHTHAQPHYDPNATHYGNQQTNGAGGFTSVGPVGGYTV